MGRYIEFDAFQKTLSAAPQPHAVFGAKDDLEASVVMPNDTLIMMGKHKTR